MPYFDDYERTRRHPVQWFGLATIFPEDYDPAEFWMHRITLDEPMRVSADALWQGYCIRRGLPLDTPYHAGVTDGRAIDLEQTPRASGIIPAELLSTHFDVYVWLTFERM